MTLKEFEHRIVEIEEGNNSYNVIFRDEENNIKEERVYAPNVNTAIKRVYENIIKKGDKNKNN